jgi:hypothetical protein
VFVADFWKRNFHFKTNFDMENKTSTNHENGNDANRLLDAACRRIGDGKTTAKGYLYRGFEIRNHGYYPPDKCIWWEAVDLKTGCADFHEHTKRDIIKSIDRALDASCR